MNLSVQWTKHLKDSKEKASFEASLRGSAPLVIRQVQLLLEEDLSLEAQQLAADFTSPSWAIQQAHINGQRLHIKKQLQLLSFIPMTKGTK